MTFNARGALRRLSVALTVASASLCGAAAAAPTSPHSIHADVPTDATALAGRARGSTTTLPGGITVELAPGTQARVFSRAQQLQLDAGGRTSTWTVALKSGHVRVRVPAASRRRAVLVATPQRLSVVALAGQVEAVADGEQATVANIDGRALCSTGSTWKPLHAGNEQDRSRTGPLAPEHPLLAAPALTLARSLWLSTRAQTDLDGLAWAPVQGATGYHVSLHRAGLAIQRLTAPPSRSRETFRGVEPGRYTLSVSAVDAAGISGRAAQASLRVVGVALPEGAYADDAGVVRLGPEQQVRFTHADDLQMISSGTHRFLDAPEPIGLSHGKRTLVMLRVPRTSDTVVAKLEPRRVSAEIRLGPQWAVWPHDAIQISIRLRHSPSGVPLQMIPRVTLGTEPIDVDFRRDGDTLRATVAPRTGAGPWVLRVDVDDQFGVPLGHDFIEIIARPRRPVARAR